MPDVNENTKIGDNLPETYTSAMTQARLLGGHWRNGRDNLRTLARELLVTAKVSGFDLAALIGDCKKEMQFAKMDKKDKNGVNVFVHAINSLSEKWADIPQEMKDRFIASPKSYPYSSLLADVKKAEKVAEEKAEQEKLAENAAENGLTIDEFKASIERENDANANIAAIERIISALSNNDVTRTANESAAFNRLCETIAAFEAAIVQESQAA